MTRHLGRDLSRFVADTYFAQNFRITSEKTRRHYRLVLKDLADVLGRSPKIGDLNDKTICRVLRHIAGRELSPYTLDQRRQYLVALSNWCSRRQILPWWVAVEKLPLPELIPEAWTMEQIDALWTACENFPGHYFELRASHWWKALHALLWDTAERISATLAIRPEWINFETGWLNIPASVRKGRRQPARYHLKPLTLALLRPMIRPGSKLVFRFPLSLASFYHHYARLLVLAGLPHGPKDKPHKMRKSVASHIERLGGDAVEALGLSRRSVAVRHYIDPSIVQRPSPNLLLPPLPPEIP